MQISETLAQSIQKALGQLDLSADTVHLEHPADLSHGDYSTNIAMTLAKSAGENPRVLAENIVAKISENLPTEVIKIEVAGPGFINFHLATEFFAGVVGDAIDTTTQFGRNDNLKGRRVMVEYTDPNPFKQFHIGHLMTNATGEATARLYEANGATVIRANYQGDVGLHVAKALWAIQKTLDEMPADDAPLAEKTKYLGAAYVMGAKAFKDDEAAENEIKQLNKVIFEKSDESINELYDKGREWSLEHFEEIYAKLGTAFNYYFFESEVAETGLKIVDEKLADGTFEKSDGAVIFRAEEYGLHTRVFVNSLGVPTYETKDLGLNTIKFQKEPDLDESIIMTANEQSSYFQVVFKAFEFIDENIAEKTRHIAHGMMLGPGGKKMSSRKGDVVTGESLISDTEEEALKKIVESQHDVADQKMLATQVAVAAIKYSILRQQSGKNIIFDLDQALSFEGDSGPYLQYTYARTQSILRKAQEVNQSSNPVRSTEQGMYEPERWLYRFPEIVERALSEQAPHHVTTYLIELARSFNSFYANEQILVADDPQSPYKIALTEAVGAVISNGLWLLGIQAPERM